MFLIIFICILSSITAYILYKKFEEISLLEAIGIFLISFSFSLISFFIASYYSLEDRKIVSWYITSKIYRESYKYEEDYTYDCFCTTHEDSNWNSYETCSTCNWTHYYTESEKWYIYQWKEKPFNINWKIERTFNTKWDRLNQTRKPIETCYWNCDFDSNYTYNWLSVDESKFNNTQVWDTSVWYEKFLNYLKNNNIVFSNLDQENIIVEYPKINNYDFIDRTFWTLSEKNIKDLNEINSDLNKSWINIWIFFTNQENSYEKILRYWKGWKINDFWIIINNDNVDIICWDNYNLKEKIRNKIQLLERKNWDQIINVLKENKKDLLTFNEKDLSKYSYLDIELNIWKVLFLFILNIVIIFVISYVFLSNEHNKYT